MISYTEIIIETPYDSVFSYRTITVRINELVRKQPESIGTVGDRYIVTYKDLNYYDLTRTGSYLSSIRTVVPNINYKIETKRE